MNLEKETGLLCKQIFLIDCIFSSAPFLALCSQTIDQRSCCTVAPNKYTCKEKQ